MQCGTLKSTKDDKTGRVFFDGSMRLLGVLNGTVRLNPHPNFIPGRSDKDQPQYVVEYMPRGGDGFYEVGAAWVKSMREGGEFLSITMDAPVFDKALNVAAFPPDNGGSEWRVQWSRPRGQQSETQAAAA